MDSSLHREAVAIRKLGTVPANFKWHTWQCIGPDVMMTGAAVTGVVRTGPRKGRPRFSREAFRVVVTDAECDAECARYEAETGKCGQCMGRGEVFAAWSHDKGSSYRPCPKCHGSGTLESGHAVAAVDPVAANQHEPTTRVESFSSRPGSGTGET